MTTSTFAGERERLAGLEALFDPPTRAVLERIGVRRGLSVAAVCAGQGSMARWLADRVGADGSVLAVDADTSYLDAIDRRNVEVRQLDILRDPLPASSFDLVYLRVVMEGVAPAAIENLLPGLKPCGTLLAIAVDWAEDGGAWPASELDVRVAAAVREHMTRAGYDVKLGRKLPSMLRDAGLIHIQAEPIQRIFQGGSPLTAMHRMTVAKHRHDLIDEGLVTEAELGQWLARLDDPEITFLGLPLVACWGRRDPDAA